jgi:hypothetical protein
MSYEYGLQTNIDKYHGTLTNFNKKSRSSIIFTQHFFINFFFWQTVMTFGQTYNNNQMDFPFQTRNTLNPFSF